MDTKSLQLFATVYESGSILKASQELFITPQGLSKALMRLEAELGHDLFSRTHQGVVPTPYARNLYPRVKELVSMLDAIQNVSEDVPLHPELRVFSVSGVIAYTGLAFIHDFEAAHSDMRLVVDEGNDELVCDLVRSGKVEVAFSAGPVDLDLFDAEPFSSCPHVLVVNENDPLAERGHVALSDLNGRSLTTLCAGYSPNRGIRARLLKAGARPLETVGFAEMYTGLILAEHGEALCVSTDYAAFLQPWPHTRILPFDDPTFTWDVYLISRKGFPLSPRAQAFRDYAPAWMRQHAGGLFSWPTDDPSAPFAHR